MKLPEVITRLVLTILLFMITLYFVPIYTVSSGIVDGEHPLIISLMNVILVTLFLFGFNMILSLFIENDNNLS